MVTVESLDGLAQCVRVDGHEILIDEPVPLGDGRGPDPYALLLAAVGGCAAMTARMYARTKGWPLEGVKVRLRHDRSHGEDCLGPGRCDRIYRRVELTGALDDDQRARLLEIVGRCPVVRSLAGAIEIVAET